MSNKKINVGILFGGKSAEHEVSLRSAKNIVEALDKSRFNPVLIGISKSGQWLYNANALAELNGQDESLSISDSDIAVALIPQSGGELSIWSSDDAKEKIDVVFPILHGPFGEDGTMQGLLKLADVPFVGAGVLGSAVGMDKDVMKRLLRDAGLQIGKYITIRAHETRPSFEEIKAQLGLPIFVKPANLGSSVGISRVDEASQFQPALDEAFNYDRKVILEAFIEGREIECAILGNEYPKASLPGEISFSHDFYSYEAKYLDENGYKIDIPADLTQAQIDEVQKVAIQTFKALECEGFGRVDVFLTKDNRILVNEINTIPGFTKVSMYPKLWEATGISYSDLITQLLDLAIQRHQTEKKIKSSI